VPISDFCVSQDPICARTGSLISRPHKAWNPSNDDKFAEPISTHCLFRLDPVSVHLARLEPLSNCTNVVSDVGKMASLVLDINSQSSEHEEIFLPTNAAV
jgi:hypothetical protein